jgi:tetratricopeptide (TPR) repeat protein
MLEKIEKYLNNELSLSERKVFENQLSMDEELAKNFAFYANTHTAAKKLANEKRKEQFENLRTEISSRTVRKMKPMIWLSGLAASLVLALGFWWFSQTATSNAEILADVYIQKHFENLPVKMDGNADSLQMGLRLFNEQKLNEAQKIFEAILQRKNNDSEATKYAGITALKLQQYDKAIQYFQALSQQTNLYSNPGKFYEALALMKQNKVDRKKAKEILNEVIINNLEGNEEAKRIIEAGY